MQKQCPIIAAIKTINGAYYGGEDDDVNIVISGGNPYICDEINYYISIQHIAVARFLAADPDNDSINVKKMEMFDYFTKPNPRDYLADKLLDKIRSLFCKQLNNFINVVLEFEQHIAVLSASHAYKNRNNHKNTINVSLPTLHINCNGKLSTTNICEIINIIIAYLNEININSIAKPLHKWEYFDHFSDNFYIHNTVNIEINTIEDCLTAEKNICGNIAIEEKYICEAANLLSKCVTELSLLF